LRAFPKREDASLTLIQGKYRFFDLFYTSTWFEKTFPINKPRWCSDKVAAYWLQRSRVLISIVQSKNRKNFRFLLINACIEALEGYLNKFLVTLLVVINYKSVHELLNHPVLRINHKWQGSEVKFFLKSSILGVFLCEKSIARIPEA
jgi:hypothetical protein